ncbi:MAG: class I SAM-dependent methyltransferase [Planctomycetia bacterium]|nr:class I SAM-dependent methyltransferase [Planctomycetia bacterium]
MLLERLLKDNPQFHYYKGVFTSWAVHPDTLRFLYSMLTPGMSTLETGCGHTTVVFSIAGTRHICITPDQGEAERIQQYCAEVGLTKNITFIIKSSDRALPEGELIPSELDYVFIDGAHRFPVPIIDWHYTHHKLKLGGIIGVDDFKIPSVKILYDFLCVEEEWELIKIMRNTAFFKKIREPKYISDWSDQKINFKYQYNPRNSNKKSFISKLIPSRLIKRRRG